MGWNTLIGDNFSIPFSEENCWQVPHENCWDGKKFKWFSQLTLISYIFTFPETVQKCWTKPHQSCQQIEEEKCAEVPREHCKDVQVKVAKNYCNKKDLNPLEALNKIVDH